MKVTQAVFPATATVLLLFFFVVADAQWSEPGANPSRSYNKPLTTSPPVSMWSVSLPYYYLECGFIYGPKDTLIFYNDWMYASGSSIEVYNLHGTKLWSWKCNCTISMPTATPDTVIVTAFYDVIAFDAFTGKIRWDVSLSGPLQGLEAITDPSDNNPIVCDGKTAYKLDRMTGRTLWQNLDVDCDESELSLGVGTFYCGYYTKWGHPFTGYSLAQYSLKTGELLWTAKPGGKSNETDNEWPPVSQGGLKDRVYTMYSYGELSSLMAVSVKDGSLIWNTPFHSNISWWSGYPTVWTDQNGNDVIMISVVVNFPSNSGRTGFMAFDGNTGNVLWTTYISTFAASSFSSASLDSNGRLWVALSNLNTNVVEFMYSIDAQTGHARQMAPPPRKVSDATVTLGTIGDSVACGCFNQDFSVWRLPV